MLNTQFLYQQNAHFILYVLKKQNFNITFCEGPLPWDTVPFNLEHSAPPNFHTPLFMGSPENHCFPNFPNLEIL